MCPTKQVSKVVHRAPASRRTRALVTISGVCLAALAAGACGATDVSRAPSSQEEGEGSVESVDVSARSASGGTVRLGAPYLSGTCTSSATASIVSSNERYVTVIFSDQAYGGDRDSPDYVKERTEGRLIGEAKTTAPKCTLHVPMKVTAGYRFSPTNIVVRGYAYRGFVFGAYRWANAALPNPTNGWDVTNDGYTFERQVPPNDPPDRRGENFDYVEPLHNLWSPTCSTSGGPDVDAELIVTLQPYTAAGTNDTIVAVDSMDVAGFGSLEKCGEAPQYYRIAQEGEACGTVDLDSVSYVGCDTSKQTNVCVFPVTNRETGACVNASRRPSPSELVVGYDEDCGGPFFKYCAKDEPLVCQFNSGDARQNASSHYGRCVSTLPVGADCKKELYGACDGYSCNATTDPCESGSKCLNGKCTGRF